MIQIPYSLAIKLVVVLLISYIPYAMYACQTQDEIKTHYSFWSAYWVLISWFIANVAYITIWYFIFSL